MKICPHTILFVEHSLNIHHRDDLGGSNWQVRSGRRLIKGLNVYLASRAYSAYFILDASFGLASLHERMAMNINSQRTGDIDFPGPAA